MKKNKKGQTIYSEDIYPGEFRMKRAVLAVPPLCVLQDEIGFMPCILTGWVQEEVHIQWAHQSLQ